MIGWRRGNAGGDSSILEKNRNRAFGEFVATVEARDLKDE